MASFCQDSFTLVTEWDYVALGNGISKKLTYHIYGCITPPLNTFLVIFLSILFIIISLNVDTVSYQKFLTVL